VPHGIVLDSGYRFGSDITQVPDAAAGKESYVGFRYNDDAGKWDVVSTAGGF
jgi:hypothetical protein